MTDTWHRLQARYKMHMFTEGTSYQSSQSTNVYIFNVVHLSTGSTTDPHNFAYIASDDSINVISVIATPPASSIKPVTTISKAHQGISCIEAFKTGLGIATAGRDGKVKLWSPRPGREGKLEVILEVSTR